MRTTLASPFASTPRLKPNRFPLLAAWAAWASRLAAPLAALHFGLRLLATLALGSAQLPAHAQQATVAGHVRLVHGEVTVLTAQGEALAPQVGVPLRVGDVVVTGTEGELHAQLEDGAYLAARPQTRIRIDAFRLAGNLQDQSWLSLLKGGLRMVSGWLGKAHPPAFRLNTPVATIGIRGTDFDAVHTDKADAEDPEAVGTHLWVTEGMGVLATDVLELDVPAGLAAFASDAAQPPALHQEVPRFLKKRPSRFEGLVDDEAANIKASILAKLQEKSLATTGETLAERIARFRAENPDSNLTDRQLIRKAVRKATQASDANTGNRANRGGRGGGGRR